MIVEKLLLSLKGCHLAFSGVQHLGNVKLLLGIGDVMWFSELVNSKPLQPRGEIWDFEQSVEFFLLHSVADLQYY